MSQVKQLSIYQKFSAGIIIPIVIMAISLGISDYLITYNILISEKKELTKSVVELGIGI